jgi:hypothetical protein
MDMVATREGQRIHSFRTGVVLVNHHPRKVGIQGRFHLPPNRPRQGAANRDIGEIVRAGYYGGQGGVARDALNCNFPGLDNGAGGGSERTKHSKSIPRSSGSLCHEKHPA